MTSAEKLVAFAKQPAAPFLCIAVIVAVVLIVKAIGKSKKKS